MDEYMFMYRYVGRDREQRSPHKSQHRDKLRAILRTVGVEVREGTGGVIRWYPRENADVLGLTPQDIAKTFTPVCVYVCMCVCVYVCMCVTTLSRDVYSKSTTTTNNQQPTTNNQRHTYPPSAGYDSLKAAGLKEDRLLLLEAWRDMESAAAAKGAGSVDLIAQVFNTLCVCIIYV